MLFHKNMEKSMRMHAKQTHLTMLMKKSKKDLA